MTDDEIKTKRLTDWKPETHIPLVKALGKFVEEAGELLEVSYHYVTLSQSDVRVPLEDELADCLAFIEMIVQSSNGELILNTLTKDLMNQEYLKKISAEDVIRNLNFTIGKALKIVGRCQIQGVSKSDPETGMPNISNLRIDLGNLSIAIKRVIDCFDLNKDRIEKRKQAKIDSKLPWLIGTATDLLPDL